MMEVISKKQLCKDVAERWKEQYYSRKTVRGSKSHINGWTVVYDDGKMISSKIIYDKLVKLNGACVPETIAEIIGNDAWTQIICDECNDDVNVAVYLGEEPDHDSATALICLSCLKEAVNEAEAALEEE